MCLGHSEQRFKREKEEMRFLRDPGAMSSKSSISQDKKLGLGKPLEGFKLLRDILKMTSMLQPCIILQHSFKSES